MNSDWNIKIEIHLQICNNPISIVVIWDTRAIVIKKAHHKATIRILIISTTFFSKSFYRPPRESINYNPRALVADLILNSPIQEELAGDFERLLPYALEMENAIDNVTGFVEAIEDFYFNGDVPANLKSNVTQVSDITSPPQLHVPPDIVVSILSRSRQDATNRTPPCSIVEN